MSGKNETNINIKVSISLRSIIHSYNLTCVFIDQLNKFQVSVSLRSIIHSYSLKNGHLKIFL